MAKAPEWSEDNPRKISPSLLQMRFKITWQQAKDLLSFIGDKPIDNGWNEVFEKLPGHEEEIFVYGKPFQQVHDNLDFYVSIFDCRSGWIAKDTGHHLYVLKWMSLPKEEEKK